MEVCAPMPRTWFAQQPGNGQEGNLPWIPLRREDQQRLEASLLAAEVGLGPVSSVPVDGGRAEVKIAERLLVDRYGTVPPPKPCPMRRVLWLRGEGNVKAEARWQPYSEEADAIIEDTYNRLVADARASIYANMPTSQFQRSLNLPDANAMVHLQLDLTLDISGGEACPCWSMTAHEQILGEVNWLGRARAAPRCPVKRGYGEVPLSLGDAEEEALGDEISQLFVLLHSAGLEPNSSDLQQSVRTFRRNMHRSQLQAAGFTENAEGDWKLLDGDILEKPPKIEVLDVSWEQGTETGEVKKELTTRLERLSLSTMPRAREIANWAAAGALLYAGHREEILSAVGDAIAGALWRFEDCHQEFTGEVMLIGHSLGGVALFDLLRGGRLDFQARSLFALGSPVGLLGEVTEDATPSALAFPGGTRLFNIFHPLDPVAYRVEPLLAPELGRKPAAKVPRSQGQEEDRGKLQNLQNFLGWNREDPEPGSPQNPLSAGAARSPLAAGAAQTRAPELKLNGRVDWVLQDELSVDESDGDAPSQALSSHTGYLKSIDVAAFVYASAVALVSSVENDLPPPEMPLVTLGEQLGQVISKRWEETGAKANVTNAVDRVKMAIRGVGSNVVRKSEQSGAADIVKGSAAAALGVAGTFRALYGTARLVGTGVGAARDAVGTVKNLGQQPTTPSPRGSPMSSPRPRKNT